METLADPPYNVLRVRSGGGGIPDLTDIPIKVIHENSYRIDPNDPIFVNYVAALPDTTTIYKDVIKISYFLKSWSSIPQEPGNRRRSLN